MKVMFTEKDPHKVVEKIKTAMGERELSKMVSFNVENKDVVVTISKLGTSRLIFSHKDASDGCELALTSEKIALAHRAFKDEVKDKIMRVIEKAGGKVLA